MKAIRMQNLRSLADTGFIELKPITLLLGQNSSGKSTFLRTFPLLRQSVETRTSGPILWFGRLVDFGDFQTAVGKYGESEEITLGFQFEVDYDTLENTQFALLTTVTLKLTNNMGGVLVRNCTVNLLEHLIQIRTDSENNMIEFKINNVDFTKLISKDYTKGNKKMIPVFFVDNIFQKELYRYIKKLLDIEKVTRKEITSLVNKLMHEKINTSENMLEVMQKYSSHFSQEDSIRVIEKWEAITSIWTINTPEFEFIRDSIMGNQIIFLLFYFNEHLTQYAQNTHYIGPTRAIAERYYRTQDLAVDEIDFQGRNLAMFLWSLGEKNRQIFATWTKKVLGFAISVQLEGGHISLMLKETDSKAEFNVADMGFGFSQILPIITQLWVLLNSKGNSFSVPITFAIEQPELHLHPTLQAKLADVFLAAIKEAKKRKIDLRLIIETHSEVIISRLGHRVAHQEITPEEINVVLFDKKDAHSPTEIRIAQYDEQGYLTNWPFGFFEPDRI